METGFRHQGFMHHGPPSRHIPMIAAVIKARLEQKHRCLYFDSKQMVAGLRSDLAQIGVDVARETAKNSLVFSSHLSHLSEDQTFDIDRMIAALEDALNQTSRDGYVGLWVSGDLGNLPVPCQRSAPPTQCRPVMKCTPHFSSMRLNLD